MSDEIHIDGKTYISSKRASELSGYAQDYIGQLARGGYIDARRIGGLWHVSLASIQEHEKAAEISKSQQSVQLHQRIQPAEAESLVSFDGVDYVPASRAANLTGYHQDYVGQLARSGAVSARQVGSRWYVGRESIMTHKAEKDRLLGAVQASSVGIDRGTSAKQLIEADESPTSYFTYTNEEGMLHPEIPVRALEDSSTQKRQNVEESADQPIPIRVRNVAIRGDLRNAAWESPRHPHSSPAFPRWITSKFVTILGAVLAVSLIGTWAVLRSGTQDGSIGLDFAQSIGAVLSSVGDVVEDIIVPTLHYIRP